MSHRPRKHKKRFPCGHRGFGRYCHRCADRQQQRQRQQRQRQQQRQQWQQTFAADPIDLTRLPKKIVLQARRILAGLAQGKGFWTFLGKRFGFDRHLIRIPITRRYRLLCRQVDDKIVPIRLLSHEEYNRVANNKTAL